MNNEKVESEYLGDLPVLSFFTGGGFLDIGFEQAGFVTKWTNEHNPVFASMYAYGMTSWRKANKKHPLPACISNTSDIGQIPSKLIERQAFPEGRPRIFGVIGGPPCPDFSSGGKHKGSNGFSGKLTTTFVNHIISLMPAFFVLENVAGLYRNKRHRAYLLDVEKLLQKAGYRLDLRVLNALELGVPQDRERLIIVGIQPDLLERCTRRSICIYEREWFPWPEKLQYKKAKSKFNWPTRSPFGEQPTCPEGIPRTLTITGAFRYLPKENQDDVFNAYSDRFVTVKEGDTSRKSFKRLHRYRFSPTACYGHNEVHLHPWKKRRLSVREAMRIQGIPDEYVLQPDYPLTAKFSLVANGVPVPLAFQVAINLRTLLQPVLKTRDENGHME